MDRLAAIAWIGRKKGNAHNGSSKERVLPVLVSLGIENKNCFNRKVLHGELKSWTTNSFYGPSVCPNSGARLPGAGGADSDLGTFVAREQYQKLQQRPKKGVVCVQENGRVSRKSGRTPCS